MTTAPDRGRFFWYRQQSLSAVIRGVSGEGQRGDPKTVFASEKGNLVPGYLQAEKQILIFLADMLGQQEFDRDRRSGRRDRGVLAQCFSLPVIQRRIGADKYMIGSAAVVLQINRCQLVGDCDIAAAR